jgi:hypothetical protein
MEESSAEVGAEAGKARMDRAITPHEVEILRWMLEHAAVGDVTAYAALPLEELRVTIPGRCDCGCCSLDFSPNAWGRSTVIADAIAEYADGQKAGLILFGQDGAIDLLEVYECDPVADRVPEIADLRPF